MSDKKYVSLNRLTNYDALIKAEIAEGDANAVSSSNSYAKSYTDTEVGKIKDGTTTVAKATSATSAASATKATQDGNGKTISSTYETKTDASTKLDTAKAYTDTKVSGLASTTVVDNKISSHNTSTSSHNDIRGLITDLTTKLNNFLDVDDTTSDQLSEVLTLIENNKGTLESLTTSKVNVSDIIDNLTTSSTTKVLSAKQGVAIKGLIDALQTELDNHNSDTTKHITATERTNWNAAKTHADSAHAPSNAEKNQNAFSNIKVGTTTVAADTATDTVTFEGSNVTITPDTTNDKITFTVADGSTSAKGIVKLTNSTSSTSTTTAATPNSVKSAYDLANTAKTNATTAQTRADSAYTLAEGKVDSLSDLGITATATELNYMDGVTSGVQAQLDAKVPTSRTINNKPLSANITLSASDVGASASGHEHSASKITSGILAIERGGTGNSDGYVRAGAKSGTTVGALATAEGRNVTASGSYCHAEGNYTYATGSSSHAEGQSTEASGNFSHAEGESSNASGYASHAEGDHTIATGDCSHAQGKYNIEDTTGTYAHIVGNGESASARSNAHTLDWEGNAWFAGNVKVGGTSYSDASELMPKSGGTFTGKVTHNTRAIIAKNNFVGSIDDTYGECCLTMLNNAGNIQVGSNTFPHSGKTLVISPESDVELRAGSDSVYISTEGYTSVSGENYQTLVWTTNGGSSRSYLRCGANDAAQLGGANYKWKSVYATTGSIQTSDRNSKRNIEDIDDRYIQLFDLVRPVTYMLINGDRVHTGFIAQEVEEAMEQVGITAEELGFFCRDIKTRAITDENGKTHEEEVLDDNGNPVYIYSLRYEEYIAIMAEKVRRLEAKYNEKLAKLDEIDSRLAALESKLN